MKSSAASLKDLWAEVECLASRIDRNNPLRPVMGGGNTHRPRFAFIFINPTPRNVSAAPTWPLQATPFIGVPAFWGVMRAAGMKGFERAYSTKAAAWTPDLASKVYEQVASNDVYMTNLVKHTASNGDAPSRYLIEQYYPLLMRELSIVQPKAIVTFGLLPLRTLTGHTVRLADLLLQVRAGQSPTTFKPLHAVDTALFACYFPTGRGNPTKAATLLKAYLQHS